MRSLILIGIILLACNASISAQYHVELMGNHDDTVTLRSVGLGKNAKIAAAEAELSAVDYVLYVGCVGTKYSLPLIPGTKKETEANNDFFSSFNNGEYRDFIESTEIIVPFGKNGLKQKSITLDITIRVKQLREYLERNGIIRKFGF